MAARPVGPAKTITSLQEKTLASVLWPLPEHKRDPALTEGSSGAMKDSIGMTDDGGPRETAQIPISGAPRHCAVL